MACKRVISLVARNIKELHQWRTTSSSEPASVYQQSSTRPSPTPRLGVQDLELD